jgi:putative addiction module killer protein
MQVPIYNRGRVKSDEKRDYDGAIEDFNQAIAFKPDDADAYYSRGHAKGDDGDYGEVIADFDRAIALDPGVARYYHCRGHVKVDQGDYEGAINDYSCAIKLDPTDAQAYYRQSLARLRLGDNSEAFEDYQHAISLDVDSLLNPDARRIFYDVLVQAVRIAERETLQSEQDQLLEIADQEIADKNKRVADLEAQLRQQDIALHYKSRADHIPSDSKAATATDTGLQVQYYTDSQGREPYTDWLITLDRGGQRRVRDTITQMRKGNSSDSKSLHASGLFERRLDSGLRIYYARESPSSVLILCGGDKPDQQSDIDTAAERLADWRARHPK